MKKTIYVLFAFLIVVLSGCSPNVYTGENIGTTSANLIMGSGRFAMADNFVYFVRGKTIYEYDIASQTTVTIDISDSCSFNTDSLFLSEEHIFFIDGSQLKYANRDGNHVKTVFTGNDGCMALTPVNQGLFYMNYIYGSLFYRDMESEEETELISSVRNYCIYDNVLYVVSNHDGTHRLYQSATDSISFEPVELSVEPNLVMAGEQGVFISQPKPFQVTLLRGDEESDLPVFTTFYQIWNNKIIYADDQTFKDGGFSVKSYDLTTGEEKLLCERVFEFCILDERYLACECTTSPEVSYILIDLETGDSVRMN